MSFGRLRISTAVVIGLLGLSAATAQADPPDAAVSVKHDVPPELKLAEARRQVETLYRKELADHSPAGHKALARKLLEVGLGTVNDLPGRYVLLEKARDLAVETADIKTATLAIAGITDTFNVDGWTMETTAIRKASASPTTTPAEQGVISSLGAVFMVQMIGAGKYEDAAAFATTVRSAGAASGDPGLRAKTSEWATFAQSAAAEHKKIKWAFDTLAKTPNDLMANTTVGSFYCLNLGDWRRGLPLMAKGADKGTAKPWTAMAARELATPDDAKEQGELAAAWWDLAETQPAAIKARVQIHAGDCYRKALPGLDGLAREMANKRLATIPDVPVVTAAIPLPFEFINPKNIVEGSLVVGQLNDSHADVLTGAKQVELVCVFDPKDFHREHGDTKKVDGAAADTAAVSHDGGMWLWGAYKELKAGKYVVAYHTQLQGKSDDSEFAFFDVSVGGGTVAGGRPKASEFPPNQWAIYPAVVNLDDTKTIEVRCWSSGHPIAIDRVYVFAIR
jgi:hypothetical protein